ncbi:hypothetical protein RHMOL_Rhmol02G0129900 [Rhododendron molle]|uniref:Uncharacterized protein n=1 Tax=Rhododendron molle TaxID=49168 RepID=A0ACC0PSL9_RHOML|nr:hypothetical protein RHMOL_Rhmol02G0129900 [Rhododendron molle]
MGEEEAQLQQQQQQPNSGEQVSEIAQQEESTQQQPTDYSWTPPSICFGVPPVRTYHFTHQFRTPSNPNNFLKGVKWSPDGSCFLTSAEDNTFRLFSLPDNGDGYYGNACSLAADAAADSYTADLIVNGGESIYDFCWYPYMSASDPVTCVFASTTRDHPIHLWDATSGELRCTYRAFDAMDEITAAFSVGFNLAGTKMPVMESEKWIFGGYNKSLRIFDVHRPGRDFKQHSTVQGNKEGQPGIISAIAFSPSHTKMLATGSYCQTTAIYSEDNMELLYILHGQEGGVTHVQFSKDGNYLYTGGRKVKPCADCRVLSVTFDPYILCWDIRKAVDIVYKIYRSSENTNQRIAFDVEPSGQHLGTGGQDGLVHIYNLQTGQWVSSFQAALDTVNGFSFHPFLPMVACSSGHRRFDTLDDSPEDFSLSGDENCASIWSFALASMEDNAAAMDCGGLNSQSEN